MVGPALKQLEADTVPRGGRLLLIDRRFVLDVSMLALRPVEPWVVGGLNASTWLSRRILLALLLLR